MFASKTHMIDHTQIDKTWERRLSFDAAESIFNSENV